MSKLKTAIYLILSLVASFAVYTLWNELYPDTTFELRLGASVLVFLSAYTVFYFMGKSNG